MNIQSAPYLYIDSTPVAPSSLGLALHEEEPIKRTETELNVWAESLTSFEQLHAKRLIRLFINDLLAEHQHMKALGYTSHQIRVEMNKEIDAFKYSFAQLMHKNSEYDQKKREVSQENQAMKDKIRSTQLNAAPFKPKMTLIGEPSVEERPQVPQNAYLAVIINRPIIVPFGKKEGEKSSFIEEAAAQQAIKSVGEIWGKTAEMNTKFVIKALMGNLPEESTNPVRDRLFLAGVEIGLWQMIALTMGTLPMGISLGVKTVKNIAEDAEREFEPIKRRLLHMIEPVRTVDEISGACGDGLSVSDSIAAVSATLKFMKLPGHAIDKGKNLILTASQFASDKVGLTDQNVAKFLEGMAKNDPEFLDADMRREWRANGGDRVLASNLKEGAKCVLEGMGNHSLEEMDDKLWSQMFQIMKANISSNSQQPH